MWIQGSHIIKKVYFFYIYFIDRGPKGYIVDEVAETYRRVNALKNGFTDHSAPKTFDFKEALKRKNSIN